MHRSLIWTWSYIQKAPRWSDCNVMYAYMVLWLWFHKYTYITTIFNALPISQTCLSVFCISLSGLNLNTPVNTNMHQNWYHHWYQWFYPHLSLSYLCLILLAPPNLRVRPVPVKHYLHQSVCKSLPGLFLSFRSTFTCIVPVIAVFKS